MTENLIDFVAAEGLKAKKKGLYLNLKAVLANLVSTCVIV